MKKLTKLDLKPGERLCPRCSGSGFWLEKTSICFRCKGAGKIVRDDVSAAGETK